MKNIVALLLTALLLCGCALPALAAQPLHLYLNIPFEGVTQQTFSAALAQARGVSLDLLPQWGMNCAEVTEFSYPWVLIAEIDEGTQRMQRVQLMQLLPIGTDEPSVVRGAIQTFIAVDAQLAAQYGEADRRLVFTEGQGKCMFADGRWHARDMERIYEQEHAIFAVAYYNNVVLRLFYHGSAKQAKSRMHELTLTYFDAAQSAHDPVHTYVPQR